MLLYHYTSVPLAETILISSIKLGHVPRQDGSIERPVVWLTNDKHHKGHGLLKGDEKPTASQIAYAQRAQSAPITNLKPHNKTKIRIGVKLPSTDHKLISWTKYCVKNGDGKDYARIIGLSAVMDLSGLSYHEMLKLCRTTATKEDTWYLYFGEVPAVKFVSIDFLTNTGYSPYDFESHGREEWEEAGFVCPSKKSLGELEGSISPRHTHDVFRAFAICDNLESTPKICFRGRGILQIYELADSRLIAGSPINEQGTIYDWIERHKPELMDCWERAKERYKFFHPQ